jgi:hypothetical protein
MPTTRGGKSHSASVSRPLHRLEGWILPRKQSSAPTTNAEPAHSLGRISIFPCEPAAVLRRLTWPYAPPAWPHRQRPRLAQPPGNGRCRLAHPMQDVPLHRLSASSIVQLVDEVPRRHVCAVADFDDLGPALGRRGRAPRLACMPDPKLVTGLDVSSMLLSRSSLASLRLFAPIGLTADVPAGRRPVPVPASGAGLRLFRCA